MKVYTFYGVMNASNEWKQNLLSVRYKVYSSR